MGVPAPAKALVEQSRIKMLTQSRHRRRHVSRGASLPSHPLLKATLPSRRPSVLPPAFPSALAWVLTQESGLLVHNR